MFWDKISGLYDLFENILRPSSLIKLREPVLDTVINFTEFMANWIVEVQKQFLIPINIVTVGGNHDTQRLLGSKPMFEDENFWSNVAFSRYYGIKGIRMIKNKSQQTDFDSN